MVVSLAFSLTLLLIFFPCVVKMCQGRLELDRFHEEMPPFFLKHNIFHS